MPKLKSPLFIASTCLAVAVGACVFFSTQAFAGYNSREADPSEKALDLNIETFQQNGISGTVAEFTPLTVKDQRCVVFLWGGSASMQCFPVKASGK